MTIDEINFWYSKLIRDTKNLDGKILVMVRRQKN